VDLEQTFFAVEPRRKLDALAALLLQHRPESALVFCHTRNDVRDVSARLGERGFSALALHGELEQRERDEVLLRFANRSCAVLVATDVAARGLDIKGLAAVVSWELPRDPDIHATASAAPAARGTRASRSRCAPVRARAGRGASSARRGPGALGERCRGWSDDRGRRGRR
jgi:ATP-dependent helicase YprA (DUF1998 family)